MTTEKQSVGFPAGLEGANYGNMTPAQQKEYGAYFDERWPQITGRNLLAAAGTGAGLAGLYHIIRHFTAEKPSQAHQNFYAGPKQIAADKKKKQPAQKLANETPTASPGPSVIADQRPGTAGAWMGANIAGVPLAAMGGAYLMNRLARMNKRKNYDAEIAAARAEYERALGEKVSALHAVYDANREKISEDNSFLNSVGKFLKQLPYNDYINPALKGYNAYAVGGAGLSAALAGKLVFDLTRQRSNAEMLRRAQDARARLSSLPPLWVTPDDVTSSASEQETVRPSRKAASA